MGRVAASELVAGVPGVELHGKKLRIVFYYKRQRCREVLDLPVTKTNVRFAINKLATVKHEIALGNFDYLRHFPDSSNLERFGIRKEERFTLQQAYDNFWSLKQHELKPSSRRRYPYGITRCIEIVGPNMLLTAILPKDFQQLKIELVSSYSASTVNHYLGVFKTLVQWCGKNGLCNAEPLIKELTSVRTSGDVSADPFEYEEFQKMLAACTHPQHRNMLTVAVYTGLRPGELRALCWDSIDMDKKVITVRRAGDQDRKRLKLPKTNEVRTVDIQPPVFEALLNQWEHTGQSSEIEIVMDLNDRLETQKVVPVFNPEITSKRNMEHDFFTDSGISKLWLNIIRRSGVRYRRFYQCRHTFASWNLTSHGNLAYIAKQMGHSDLEMLQRVYGKWIESASKSEAEMIWQMMQAIGHFAPMVPQKICKDTVEN